ncbi:MAG: DUF4340 domain-containing protein [Lachnospiraceae bacterium]
MSRSKKLLGLLGVLVVICVATIAMTKYEEHKENIKNSDTIIVELDTDSVTALSWKNSTTELSFHKDGSWTYDEDAAFPVDEEKIQELLDMFKEFGVSFIIEDVEDYSQYGLDEPVCTIQITTAEETEDTLEITLGDFSKMDSKRYVSIGDGNVYLVNNDPLDQFDAELSDMIKHDETPSIDLATKITFSGDIDYQISYEEESGKSYQAEDVYFVNDGNDTLSLDTSLVNSYLSEISYLDLSEYVTYNVTEEELASYGLDSPDLSITVDYTYENDEKEETEDTFVLHISRDPSEKAAAEGEGADDGASEDETITAYARVGDSQIVYQLAGTSYEELMKATCNDLRHQQMYYGDFSDVTQIDILLEDKEYSITSEKDEEERTYFYEDEELDMLTLKGAIKDLKAEEFTDAGPDGKEEIRLTLHLENESFPQIEIVLYRHDGETCLAEINRSPVAYVDRSDVVDLIEAVNSIIL